MAEPSYRKVRRPRLPGSAKFVRLRDSVFHLWKKRKEYLGFSGSCNSEFAEFLLHRRLAAVAENNLPRYPVDAEYLDRSSPSCSG